jgi:hypothetical protein
MEKFITKDKLADFITKMWDAGIKCDLKPDQSEVTLWSIDFGKMEHVKVVSEQSYSELIRGIQCSLLPIDDGMNTCTQEG